MQYFPEVVTGRDIRRWEEGKRGVRARVVAGEDRHFLRAHDDVVTPQALKQCLRRSVAWLPRGSTAADTTLVKALARGFRWRRMLETGRYATTDELAAAEKINSSYVSRLLRLTLLSPDIVEAILDGRQPDDLTLPGLMEPFPVEWAGQFGDAGGETVGDSEACFDVAQRNDAAV